MHPCASGGFQPVQFVLNQNGIDLLEQRLDNGDKDHDISCKIVGILAVPHQQLNEDLSVWNEIQCYLTVCSYAR
jgi:hypothetical protein